MPGLPYTSPFNIKNKGADAKVQLPHYQCAWPSQFTCWPASADDRYIPSCFMLTLVLPLLHLCLLFLLLPFIQQATNLCHVEPATLQSPERSYTGTRVWASLPILYLHHKPLCWEHVDQVLLVYICTHPCWMGVLWDSHGVPAWPRLALLCNKTDSI